jgi:hypothetical protein
LKEIICGNYSKGIIEGGSFEEDHLREKDSERKYLIRGDETGY